MNSSDDKVSASLNSGGTAPGGTGAATPKDAAAVGAASVSGATTVNNAAVADKGTTAGSAAVSGNVNPVSSVEATSPSAAGVVVTDPANGSQTTGAMPGQVGAISANTPKPIYTNPAATTAPVMNPNLMSSHFGPISSGTGDIVLSNTDNKNPKKWLILGGAIGAVLIVMLIIFLVMRMIGGSSGGTSDMRKAFNIYANYFLTGEAKDEDLPAAAGADDELIDERDTADLVGGDNLQGAYVETASSDEPSIKDVYFYEHVGTVFSEGEDNGEYKEKILAYYENFRNDYANLEDEDDETVDLVDDYGRELELVLKYDGAPSWSELALWEAYHDGGKSGLETYVKEMSGPFEDFGVINGKNYYELLVDYGQKYLELLPKYEEMGCLTDEGVDYTCTEAKKDTNSEALEEVVSRDYSDLVDLINGAREDLYFKLYDIKNEVYAYINDGRELIDVEEK